MVDVARVTDGYIEAVESPLQDRARVTDGYIEQLIGNFPDRAKAFDVYIEIIQKRPVAFLFPEFAIGTAKAIPPTVITGTPAPDPPPPQPEDPPAAEEPKVRFPCPFPFFPRST